MSKSLKLFAFLVHPFDLLLLSKLIQLLNFFKFCEEFFISSILPYKMALINVDEDSWLNEFAALERLSQQIQKQISDRDSQKLTSEYNKISARIRIQLKQFENEMTQLKKKLNNIGKSFITEQERERRMRQLEVLASKKVQLDSRFQNTSSASTRNQLFEVSGSSSTRITNPFDDDDPILENNVPIDSLRSEQTQIIKEQDKGLENLSQVISRQKKLAMRIGTEIEDQSEIIDNITVQMDHTSDRVNNETRHVERVSEHDSTWSYWVVIISLFVAIIIVGIL
ncbi:CLUMA_CG009661, isoform A [Clunio marinus]|uniref:CLUMA_CG009661, isoform A n=1 Tax=Clunio marinus TaxID=568069 RepID=A0A1J1I931_9DIPT|nr:CLUMA_CG009661, isoform A [Clunio marinus]